MSSPVNIAHAIVMILIILTSIAGNSITLIAIVRIRPLRNATGALLANLAVADLLQTIIGMPLILTATIADGWRLGSVLCTISGLFNSLFCITSLLTLAVVSCDRYLAIIHPLNYEELMTANRVKLIIGCVWFQALLVSLLPLCGWSRYQYLAYQFICTVQWEYHISYTVFLSITCFVTPLFVTVVCYSQVMRHARRQAREVHAQNIGTIGSSSSESAGRQVKVRRLNPQHSQTRLIAWVTGHVINQGVEDKAAQKRAKRVHKQKKKQMKIVLTLVAVNGTFVLCWLPHFVGIFCLVVTAGQCPWHDNFFSITTNLAMFNSTCNVFIYVFLNRPFRKAFLKMMGCRKTRSHPSL